MSRCVHIIRIELVFRMKPCNDYRFLVLDDQTMRTIRRMTKEFLRCLTEVVPTFFKIHHFVFPIVI